VVARELILTGLESVERGIDGLPRPASLTGVKLRLRTASGAFSLTQHQEDGLRAIPTGRRDRVVIHVPGACPDPGLAVLVRVVRQHANIRRVRISYLV